MSSLFGYYGLGLTALQAAQTGIQVTGDNIANINTPGYGRRLMELQPGIPVRVAGGYLSNGVDIARISRQNDALIQFNLEREKGNLAGNEEQLRGLRAIESSLGDIQSDGLTSLYADFSLKFSELSGAPTDLSRRRAAISSSEALAGQLRTTYAQLDQQRRDEDQAVREITVEINRLAESLADLNRQIANTSVDGGNSPLRDQRQVVVEQLAELTGGSTATDERGDLQFTLAGGGTLVTADHARPLTLTTAADGNAQVQLAGRDVTNQSHSGKLGALIELRDEAIPARLAELDAVAADLITRANALTTGATDLNGDPGVHLFEPDPAPAGGAAATIRVNQALLDDASLLAISDAASGAPGNGTVAEEIAALRETASAALGNRSPEQFLIDQVADAGQAVAQSDVSVGISQGLVGSFEQRRDEISGVSLDEEAINLIRYQRSYEAAARFISVLNEITEITVNIGR